MIYIKVFRYLHHAWDLELVNIPDISHTYPGIAHNVISISRTSKKHHRWVLNLIDRGVYSEAIYFVLLDDVETVDWSYPYLQDKAIEIYQQYKLLEGVDEGMVKNLIKL